MKVVLTGSSQYQIKIALAFLLFCCLLAYWPLTFHVFSLKNDALNYFLPVRYQVSESINNGHWPLWSPYFNLGYPLHADMQSGVWNPFVWLLSLAGPYTLYTLQLETLLYVYLSGVGMFFLLRYFQLHFYASITGAIAYMLCGFISDSGQFLNWISGAAFLPFAFLYYYRTLKEKTWKPAILCGFFIFLQFTCAYPADFILLTYLLAATCIWYLIQLRFKRKERILLRPLILSHLIILVSFILLSLPAIISYLQFLPLSERGSGASYEDVMSNPLHPLLLFSYVTPLGVWDAPGVSRTDPLARNSYIGLFTLILLLAAFLKRSPDSFIRYCKWGFIISMILSFGEIGGLRIVTYYLLPLFNTFRHPANIKIFTIFFGCLLAAHTMNRLIAQSFDLKARKTSFFITTAAIAGILVWACLGDFYLFGQQGYKQIFTLLKQINGDSLKTLLDSITFSDILIINIVIQIPFLFIIYKSYVQKIKPFALVLCSAANCVLFTSLFQPFTVVKKGKASHTQAFLNKLTVKDYPLPDIFVSLKENSRDGEKYMDEIGCLNMYNKKVGRSEYRITPSNLLSQNDFWYNVLLRDCIMGNPLLYKAEKAYNLSDSNIIKEDTANKKFVFLENSKLKDEINKIQPADSISIKPIRFTPNRFEFEIENHQPSFFVLLQNYYPLWKLYVNGKAVSIQKCNISFMGFFLQPGMNHVSFIYQARLIKAASFISLVSILLILVFILFGSPRNKKN